MTRFAAVAIAYGLTAFTMQVRDDGVQTGTARISGVVLAADAASQPIRRALVTISGDGLRQSRTAITDDDGRFVLDRLPSARVTLTVSKAAYLTTSFGARRPGRPGTTIQINDGESRDITMRLTRGAVIAGTIRDERGLPLAGVQVIASRIGAVTTPAPFGDEGWLTTDDRGAYRAFGLEPGEYLVLAVMRRLSLGSSTSWRSDAEMDAVLAALQRRSAAPAAPIGSTAPPSSPAPETIGFPVTYYPGTAVIGNATKITVGAAEEHNGIDFAIAPVRLTTISGTVAAADGGSLGDVQLSVYYDQPNVASMSGARPVLSQRPSADGTFRYTQVPPGRYTIMARARATQTAQSPGVVSVGGRGGALPPAAGDATTRYASVDVDVDGQPVSGVTLTLRPGVNLGGRVVFDGAAPAAADDVARVTVTIVSPAAGGSSVMNNTAVGRPFLNVAPARVGGDGTFAIQGIAPFDYRLRVTLPPPLRDKWFLRSATAGGRDITDAPIEIRDRPIDDVVITFSDRPTGVRGTLTAGDGSPASNYFVVVLPRDRALWRPDTRRIQSTR
ncbi:MAG TPA: carboxypeptidase-like regulatory domain-containing protein, partial [Vicinamibacterales bacterium]|nr:carboxypeptidase-like regulatory domain-containing protein [Vicinamibacterales bacterium]